MNQQLPLRLVLVVFAAFILTILPIPAIMIHFRPPWILLISLYIQLYAPRYFSVSLLCIFGLCLDLLLSTLLGEHSFALVLTALLASTRVIRFHHFSLPQQMASIFLLSFSYEGVLYLIDTYQGYQHSLMSLSGSTLASLIAWLWISTFLKAFLFVPTRPRSKWA